MCESSTGLADRSTEPKILLLLPLEVNYSLMSLTWGHWDPSSLDELTLSS
jgi:hypothetical protein